MYSFSIHLVLVERKLNCRCDVVYLDYGNWHPVAKSDIHPLLPRFALLPAQAIACSLTKVDKYL